MAASLALAAVCDAALYADGSFVFFNLIDLNYPFAPEGRLINEILHGPVVLMAAWTDALLPPRLVFNLVYCCLPFCALALAWWVVRRRDPSLFLWAALGIGIGTLPGQMLFVSEQTLVAQFFWPLWLYLIMHIPPPPAKKPPEAASPAEAERAEPAGAPEKKAPAAN